MTLSPSQLQQLASLAYLSPSSMLTAEISDIIGFINNLTEVDTTDIEPLRHPMDALQPLREDKAIPCHFNQALEKIAPAFQDNLYLVPQVLTSS
jgi:aspartyl-tRNA(Asn)/glutamyl-tRNA(Gln) amidotransferase subunit C